MKFRLIVFICALATLFGGLTLTYATAGASSRTSVEGVWTVDTVGAPFLEHGFAFHDDHTLTVTFPDAAEATNSASTGLGTWKEERGGWFRGAFFEVNADKATGKYTTTLVVTFRVHVTGDKFTGPASATYRDKAGKLVQGPFPATLNGTRFTL